MHLSKIIYAAIGMVAYLNSNASSAPASTALSKTNTDLDNYHPSGASAGQLHALKVQGFEPSKVQMDVLEKAWKEKEAEKAYREAMDGVRKPNYTQAAEIVGDSLLYQESGEEHKVDKRLAWNSNNCTLPSEANKYEKIVPTAITRAPCNYVKDVWTEQFYNQRCKRPILLASYRTFRQCLDSSGNRVPNTTNCQYPRFTYAIRQDLQGGGASYNTWASCVGIANVSCNSNPSTVILTEPVGAPYSRAEAELFFDQTGDFYDPIGVRLWTSSPGILPSEASPVTISNEHFEILRQFAQRRCDELDAFRTSASIRNRGCPEGQVLIQSTTNLEFEAQQTWQKYSCAPIPAPTLPLTGSSSAVATPTLTPYHEMVISSTEDDSVGIATGTGVVGGMVLGIAGFGIAGVVYFLKKKREEGHYEVTEAVHYAVSPPLARPEAPPVEIIELREEDEDEPPPPLPPRSFSLSKDLNYAGIDVGEDEEKPHESLYEPVGQPEKIVI